MSRIYHRNGRLERSEPAPKLPPIEVTVPTTAGIVPVTDIMARDVIGVRRDLPIAKVIELVLDNYIGCIPVVDDEDLPIGMITKRDIVEQLGYLLCGRLRPLGSVEPPETAENLMLPLALSLDEHASVLQAAQMMVVESLHHAPVVSRGRLIGVVSSLDIARWIASNDGALPS